ncbi:MAG: hypothetical protein ACXVJD_05885 [Mucilaginibacter sp.]
MKIVFYAFLLFLLAAGCKNETVNPRSGLFGKWELRAQSGGWVMTKTYPPGNGNVLRFNQDSTFAFYKGAQLTIQGTFQVVTKGSTGTNEKTTFIYYNHTATGDIFELKKDTLVIGTSIADGPSSVYVRL